MITTLHLLSKKSRPSVSTITKRRRLSRLRRTITTRWIMAKRQLTITLR